MEASYGAGSGGVNVVGNILSLSPTKVKRECLKMRVPVNVRA